MNEELIVRGRRRVRRAAVVALLFVGIAVLNAAVPGNKDAQGYLMLAFVAGLGLLRYFESRGVFQRTR
jgi:hypothetical protein